MKESKYYSLYKHFKALILDGSIKENEKLPSIRACAESFGVSRTTVETAYDALAAEGYILPKPQSGFVVCKILQIDVSDEKSLSKNQIKFDLAGHIADKSAFNFVLWRKYVKSALRQDERLLSYGQSQGEADLRAAIADYVRKQRGVICSAEQIVVGAGTQSLISILCGILKDAKTVAFVGSSFSRGAAVFEDHGRKILSMLSVEDGIEKMKDSPADIIYTSPSHIDRWGSVMTTVQRQNLLSLAKNFGSVIIEDDYDSEFRYQSKPIPPLRAMNGGNEVIYIGTFSSLLLPSIRISFMVLPASFVSHYRQKADLYNQTASKTEQIALCQYIRDGHLGALIRKQRRYYMQKTQQMIDVSNQFLPQQISVEKCSCSYLLKLKINLNITAAEFLKKCEKCKIKLQAEDGEDGAVVALISTAGISVEEFKEVCSLLFDY